MAKQESITLELTIKELWLMQSVLQDVAEGARTVPPSHKTLYDKVLRRMAKLQDARAIAQLKKLGWQERKSRAASAGK